MTVPDRDGEQLGVCRREDARQAALTVPEREEETYGKACVIAAARRQPYPDREAHRAAFYARHDYIPTKEDR